MDPSSDPSMSRSQFFLFAVVAFETIITFMYKNGWIENYFPEILIMNFLEQEKRLRTTFLYWRLTPEEKKKKNSRNCSSATLIRFVAMQGRILADLGLSSYSPEVIYSHFTSSTEGNKDSFWNYTIKALFFQNHIIHHMKIREVLYLSFQWIRK